MKTPLVMVAGLLALVGCGSVESAVEKANARTSKKYSPNCSSDAAADFGALSDLELELLAKAKPGFGERNTDLCAHDFNK